MFYVTGFGVEFAWLSRTGGTCVSVDSTPGTVLTRLEGAGYRVMLVSPKGEGWIFTIIAHGCMLVGPFF